MLPPAEVARRQAETNQAHSMDCHNTSCTAAGYQVLQKPFVLYIKKIGHHTTEVDIPIDKHSPSQDLAPSCNGSIVQHSRRPTLMLAVLCHARRCQLASVSCPAPRRS